MCIRAVAVKMLFTHTENVDFIHYFESRSVIFMPVDSMILHQQKTGLKFLSQISFAYRSLH